MGSKMGIDAISRPIDRRRIVGLRDWDEPSKVRVYDAKTGELKRVDPPTYFQEKPASTGNRRPKSAINRTNHKRLKQEKP